MRPGMIGMLGMAWCCAVVAVAAQERGDLQAAEPRHLGARIDPHERVHYPKSPFVIDVTQAPYMAKGDGVTDDTQAIQRALSDVMGQHQLLYFPAGTYLISKTLLWSKQNSSGKEAWGKNFLQGESPDSTVIRLKDATFTDRENPASMMWCGGFGSADWFHNYVQGITFDVGHDNPGAIGLQFYSNNSGAIRNCRFIAPAGSGLVGLDLAHRDMNGPLLVRHCEVIGFERGIATGHAVNSQTFEHITLRKQTEFGFDNEGQTVSIRGMRSENAVPAIRSYGLMCAIELELLGLEGAERWPAIVNYNGGQLFVRDVETRGYQRAIGDVQTPDWFAATRLTDEDEPESLGPAVLEYGSHPALNPFSVAAGSLRLDIQETPEPPQDEPTRWANVDDFGADPTGQRDSSAAIQRAMDSGAKTIFLPGSYLLESTVTVGGKVSRIVGVGGMIDYFAKSRPDFRIVDGESPTLTIEHFAYVHGGIEIDTRRTLIFRSVSDCDLTFTNRGEGSDLYFEDFVTHDLHLRNHRVWARQLNIENEGTHLSNDGGQLWILGYKTERGGTLLETRGGGRSEILGGFSYTTTAGKLAPMWVNEESTVFAFFREICFNGDPFEVIVRERQGGEEVIVRRGEGETVPYVSRRRR